MSFRGTSSSWKTVNWYTIFQEQRTSPWNTFLEYCVIHWNTNFLKHYVMGTPSSLSAVSLEHHLPGTSFHWNTIFLKHCVMGTPSSLSTVSLEHHLPGTSFHWNTIFLELVCFEYHLLWTQWSCSFISLETPSSLNTVCLKHHPLGTPSLWNTMPLEHCLTEASSPWNTVC